MIVFIIAVLALIAGIVFLYVNTVEGWQDQDGFHYGKKPDEDL